MADIARASNQRWCAAAERRPSIGRRLTGRPSFCAGEQTEPVSPRRRRTGPYCGRCDGAAGLVEHAGRRGDRLSGAAALDRRPAPLERGVERRQARLGRAFCSALKNIDPAPGPAEGGQRRTAGGATVIVPLLNWGSEGDKITGRLAGDIFTGRPQPGCAPIDHFVLGAVHSSFCARPGSCASPCPSTRSPCAVATPAP
jgi:hypothetical protein